MKINIKAKDFADKAGLQKTLETKLKKPVQYLAKTPGASLPFCYEVEYFEDGTGFICIGETKEVQNLYKKQRSKGQSKEGKVDKKKVAFGTVTLNNKGVYEFVVEGGLMKRPQAKTVIKSWGITKKTIGDNFTILKNAPEPLEQEVSEESTENNTEDNTANEGLKKKRALRKAKRQKVKENVNKLQDAAGVAEESKIRENLEKYKQILEELKTEAMADGEIDSDEQAEINELQSSINELEVKLERLGGRKAQLNPKRRAKVQENISKIDDKLKEIAEKLGIQI